MLGPLRITVGESELTGGLRKAREMLRTATGLHTPMFITLTGDR